MWYRAAVPEGAETPPLGGGCKTRAEVIADCFWTAAVVAQAASLCVRHVPETARELLAESRRWRGLGASLVE